VTVWKTARKLGSSLDWTSAYWKAAQEPAAGPLRDRVLFETAYVCGARASEVCGLYAEDLDLRLDDEHVRVHDKGGSVRLDGRGYVSLLKLCLARAGYTAGPLFRASINGRDCPPVLRPRAHSADVHTGSKRT
jgi:integrase